MTCGWMFHLTSLAAIAPREEEEFVTELRYLPGGWGAVAGVLAVGALCWAIVWMYAHEGRRGASTRVRRFLAAVRCAVLLCLVVILLEPVRVRILRRWIDSYTIVLADNSSSMDLADTYRDEPARRRVQRVLGEDHAEPVRRAALVDHILGADNKRFLRDLARNNRIKLYTFADEPHLMATLRAAREKPAPAANRDASDGATPREPTDVDAVDTTIEAMGPATNVERALRRSVEALGSAPVAGVVVLSDGGFNQGASAVETAHVARERDLPVYVIGIGDPADPRNIRVTEVLAPPNAFQRDPFSIAVRLAAEGLDGETVDVLLRVRNASEGGRADVADRRQVRVGPGGAIEPISFEQQQQRVGRFVYTVEVPVREGETVADDNSKQVTVNVIDARTRVLLVAGGPSWEYRYVSRLLERDDTFDVSCWLQSADLSAVRDGNTIIDHLPITAKELFEYDVVVLMDPDHEEFDGEWARLVDTMVTEYGGGLLVTAARAHTPAFMRDRALKPLHDLLPITSDPEADIVLNAIGHYQLKPSPIDVPSSAHGHQIMRLADDPVTSKLLWQQLGEVYWYYPVLREKPVATVLMRLSVPRVRDTRSERVLATVQFVGAGRSGFLAMDSTWRWRRQSVERFNRFWVQLIRYLAEGKLLGGTARGVLLTESEEYALGEAVTVTARILDAQYKPIRRDEVAARYVIEHDQRNFVLQARSDRPGWFEGRFVPDRTGSYTISINMPEPAHADGRQITREIRVTRPNIEILRPQMNRADLVALAEESADGQYFEVDEASKIPALIPDLHEEVPVRSRPTPLWDNWVVLVLLISLLSIEWAVRKWHRLL